MFHVTIQHWAAIRNKPFFIFKWCWWHFQRHGLKGQGCRQHFRTIHFFSGGILACSQPSSFYFDCDANYLFNVLINQYLTDSVLVNTYQHLVSVHYVLWYRGIAEILHSMMALGKLSVVMCLFVCHSSTWLGNALILLLLMERAMRR